MKKSLAFATCLGMLLSCNIAWATIIDFDDLTPGTVVDTIQGVTFTSSVDALGLDLIASTGFDTTSGLNYLGVDDGGFEVFFPGDTVTLNFAAPVTNLTVDFISSPFTPGGVFSIETSFGSAASEAVPGSILPDWGEVITVSFSSATPFSSAQLLSWETGDIYSFNIDTIDFVSVPEPSTLLLTSAGLALAGIFARRLRKYA